MTTPKSPSTLAPGVLVAAGAVLGSLLTYALLSRTRTRRRRNNNLALAQAEDRRKLLPSTILLVRHGESEGNADQDAVAYQTRQSSQTDATWNPTSHRSGAAHRTTLSRGRKNNIVVATREFMLSCRP